MEDIATEAGVAKRTVYLHFQNKHEACLAAMDRNLDRSLTAMDEVLAITQPGIETLRQVLQVRLLDRIDSFLPYHHTLAEAVKILYPGKVSQFRSQAAPDIERVARAIFAGQADGTIKPCDAHQTAELLVRGTNGFLPSALSGEEVQDVQDLRRRITIFIGLLIEGLRNRAP